MADTTSVLTREQVTNGLYLYRRPGFDKWIPARVQDGTGDFTGETMVAFYTDSVPTRLKNIPADAEFKPAPADTTLPTAGFFK